MVNDRLIPLHPLVLSNLHEPEPGADVLLFDGRDRNRLVFVGTEHKQSRSDLYVPFSQALDAKGRLALEQDPVSAWDQRRVRSELFQCMWRAEANGSQQGSPATFVTRPAIEQRISGFLESASPGVLLTGPPGSGRTTLLARTVEQAAAAGRPAIWLRVGQLAPMLNQKPRPPLTRVLSELLALPYDFDAILDAGGRGPERGLLLGLDGVGALGAAEDIAAFLADVEAQLLSRDPDLIQVIATLQSQGFERAADTGFSPGTGWWHELGDDELRSIPELRVPPMSDEDAATLYEALRNAAGAAAPKTPWSLLPRAVRERALVPAFAARLVDGAAGRVIRSTDVAIDIDATTISTELLGAVYAPRLSEYVDSFPQRRSMLLSVLRYRVEHATHAVPVDHLLDEHDVEDYAAVLWSGVLVERFDPAASSVSVSFASPSMVTAVTAEWARAFDEVEAAGLSETCRLIPGLEDGLAIRLMRALPASGSKRLPGLLGSTTGQGIVAKALLRTAEAHPDRLEHAVSQVLAASDTAFDEVVESGLRVGEWRRLRKTR